VVELGLGLGNRCGGERKPDGGERVYGGDLIEERWRMEGERERVSDGGERK
jgi:hypothetical protein